MGLHMLEVLVLLVTTFACTDASRYMNTDDGARHRLWPLPFQRPFHAQDDSAILIWPMPSQVSRGNLSMSVSPLLEISQSVAGLIESQSSFIIADTFHRYKHIIFSHTESHFNTVYPTELLLNSEELYLEKLIVNVSSDDDTLDFETDESYHLYIPSDLSVEQAYLQANTVYGALRGLETFSQLCVFNFTSKMVEIKNAPWDIVDSPRFKYRGILIDTSRHYQPIDAIKQVIDSMAYAKLNVLHWHMVDEESFPIEIPSLPKIWSGAYTPSERYTIADAQEIVGYAKARGIKVMAEIDVPGHAESW